MMKILLLAFSLLITTPVIANEIVTTIVSADEVTIKRTKSFKLSSNVSVGVHHVNGICASVTLSFEEAGGSYYYMSDYKTVYTDCDQLRQLLRGGTELVAELGDYDIQTD